MVSETIKLFITADTAQARAKSHGLMNFMANGLTGIAMAWTAQGVAVAKSIESQKARLSTLTKGSTDHTKSLKEKQAINEKLIEQEDKISVFSKNQTREAIAQAYSFNIKADQMPAYVSAVRKLADYSGVEYGNTKGMAEAAKRLGNALGGNVGMLTRSGTLTKIDVDRIKKKKNLNKEQLDILTALNDKQYKYMGLKTEISKAEQVELANKKANEKAQAEIGKAMLDMWTAVSPSIQFAAKNARILLPLSAGFVALMKTRNFLNDRNEKKAREESRVKKEHFMIQQNLANAEKRSYRAMKQKAEEEARMIKMKKRELDQEMQMVHLLDKRQKMAYAKKDDREAQLAGDAMGHRKQEMAQNWVHGAFSLAEHIPILGEVLSVADMFGLDDFVGDSLGNLLNKSGKHDVKLNDYTLSKSVGRTKNRVRKK